MQKPKLVWELSESYARGSVDGLVKFRILQDNDNGFEVWTVAASRTFERPAHLEMQFVACENAVAWCKLLWEQSL